MTGVVKRNLSQSQILKGIQEKNSVIPKYFLMVLSDEMIDYKGDLRLVLQLSGKGRYLTLKLSNIWINRNV